MDAANSAVCISILTSSESNNVGSMLDSPNWAFAAKYFDPSPFWLRKKNSRVAFRLAAVISVGTINGDFGVYTGSSHECSDTLSLSDTLSVSSSISGSG